MARACAIEGGQVAARCRAARHTAFSRQAEGSGRERRHAAVVEEGGRCDLLIRKDKRQLCLFASFCRLDSHDPWGAPPTARGEAIAPQKVKPGRRSCRFDTACAHTLQSLGRQSWGVSWHSASAAEAADAFCGETGERAPACWHRSPALNSRRVAVLGFPNSRGLGMQ